MARLLLAGIDGEKISYLLFKSHSLIFHVHLSKLVAPTYAREFAT